MSNFIDARVIQKTGSEAEWLANDLILYKGELALVTQGDRVVNIKVGNGTKKFSELPYIYNGGFTDSVTPTTQGSTLVDGMYIANGAGTYTNMGGLIVKDGYFTIISKIGTTYKIASEVKMPEADLTEVELKDWSSLETGLTYPTIRLYNELSYQVRKDKQSTSVNPLTDVDNWRLLDYTPSNGIAIDGGSIINIATNTDIMSISGTIVAVCERKRYFSSVQQNVNLINNQPSVLYMEADGTIKTIESQSVNSIPKSAIIFASYRKMASSYYSINGLINYSTDGVKFGNIRNIYYGSLDGVGVIDFNLSTNKISIISTNILHATNGYRLVVTPQSQIIDLATSGTHVLYFNANAEIKSELSSNITNIPANSIIIGVYTRTSNNTIEVSGIDKYTINNVSSDYINKGFGKLVSYDGAINITGQTLEVKGLAILLIGRTRYNLPISSVNFSSNPSIFYYSPSLNQIGTTLTSNINLPADSIIFGGCVGSRKGREFEIWGIEDYTINNFPKNFWQYKNIQKKLITDFDPTNYYYICNSNVSMTDTDSEPLIGSDSNLMKGKYESLMANYPDLIKKEELVTIATELGGRTIDVFTFTPPTINTDNRIDGGVVSAELPHIFINCSMHGAEKTASMACYLFFKDVLENWQSNKILEWFRFNVKISIIPTANPYGWIKHGRANGNKVDLNRNFPYLYISNMNPNSETWSGLNALDQPESLAINSWIERNKSDLLLGVDFHNFFGDSNSKPSLQWTEGVSQFTCELGRVAAQRISRGSRDSSSYLPRDYNIILGDSSYVTNSTGRLAGQLNNLIPYGLTFEVSQNFRFNPNFKPNDNESLRLSAEVFGNSLAIMTWKCIEDYNSKRVLF